MFVTALALMTFVPWAKQTVSPPVDKNGLLLPYVVEKDRLAKGDYLAPYAYLVKREKEYAASDMWADAYHEALATYASFIGLTQEAIQEYSKARAGRSRAFKLPEGDPLEGYKPEDAVQYLLKQAEHERVIMIGEAHHVPQTRVIGVRLLKGLWDRGYRYLAAETFATKGSAISDPEFPDRMYPVQNTGYYTKEPVFGEMVRRARRLGFKLVAYEETGRIKVDSTDRQALWQAREDEEAQNIKAIFDADPKAKVLVWNGYSHNSERPDQDGGILMGLRFKQIAKIDPYTVNLSSSMERDKPETENPIYRYAADKDLIKDETVFVKGGKPLSLTGDSNDCSVFLPRTKLVQGRPDWLGRELRRYPFPVPQKMIVGEGLHLAQVFYEGEPETATPVDQVLIRPGEPLPLLMVPPAKLWVRVLDEQGHASETFRFGLNATDGREDMDETIKDRGLATELERRFKVDQDARTALIESNKKNPGAPETAELMKKTEAIDRENTAWLKKVVDERGWPGKSLVGVQGAGFAWLLVQHADKDPKFQRRCLDLMKPLAATGEVGKSNFAYLTDRVLLAEGKKQVYGTQTMPDGKGHWMVRPTEDPGNLDKRRIALGLGPIADYLKLIEESYGKSKG